MAAPASDNATQETKENDSDISSFKMYYKKSARGLVHRQEFDCVELMNNFAPKYKDGRKKTIFKLIVPDGANDCFGTLVYGRHQLIELPATIPDPTDFIKNKMIIQPNIYQYISNTQHVSKLHFYVNFADANLFGFYNGSLFAQDEIMTLEHPILASLREQLLTANKKENSKLIPYCRGSIIILNALQHGYFAQNKLQKIYGGKFARSTIDKIRKSITINKPAVIDNIICMASLMGMLHKYKESQINKLLKTAYCGFNGAVCEVLYQQLKKNKNNEDNKNEEEKEEKIGIGSKEIIVHTGNWGCGAFGGNIIVHTMIQVIAAVAAGVDMMYYHSVDKRSMKKAQEGCNVLLKELYPKCKNKKGKLKTKLFVTELLKRNYKWGTPNGT